jgi:KDO2-lipid IV(A) lauroyltransferase
MAEWEAKGASVAPTAGESFGLRWRYAVFGFLFLVAYRVLGLRRNVIRDNLRRSFPAAQPAELRAIRNDFVRRQGEIFAEIDYARRRIDAEEMRERVRLLDPHGFLAADGARLILLGAHQCNFEWMLLRISLELGSSIIGLYKPLSGYGERYFLELRTRFGAQLLPAKSIREELGRIREARALGLIADQVPRTSPERHWTTFLTQDTAFYKGPERLSRLLRAQVVYVQMRRFRRGVYEIELVPLNAPGEKLPGGELTERYARTLEGEVQADPAGWWWSHKRWKLKRDAPVRRAEAGNHRDRSGSEV